MNIGFFYQTGYRYVAAYHALKQLRKFFPEAPVAMYEDNSYVMEPLSKIFNCAYNRTQLGGRNDPNSGRPAYDLKTTLAWLDRVYESCNTTLKSAEWVMNFEDDVWIRRPLLIAPQYDLSGIGGVALKTELNEFFNFNPPKLLTTYGCGGSLFNREKFIKAYNDLKTVSWEKVAEFDKRPLEWTDCVLTFMFHNSNFTTGQWEDASQYQNRNVTDLGSRSGWPGTNEEIEKAQVRDVAVIHCWKPYYWPTQEEINYVNEQINSISKK